MDLREKDQRPKLSVAQEILITIPFLVACTLLLGILYPHLGRFAIPVLVYGMTLASMCRVSLLRYSKTT